MKAIRSCRSLSKERKGRKELKERKERKEQKNKRAKKRIPNPAESTHEQIEPVTVGAGANVYISLSRIPVHVTCKVASALNRYHRLGFKQRFRSFFLH